MHGVCAAPKCLELIKDGTCKVTHCGHEFHVECIDYDLVGVDNCPCCKEFLGIEDDSSEMEEKPVNNLDDNLDIDHCRCKKKGPCVKLIEVE